MGRVLYEGLRSVYSVPFLLLRPQGAHLSTLFCGERDFVRLMGRSP